MIRVIETLARGPAETVLSSVLEPDVSLAIWDRTAPRALLDGMAGLCPAHLPQGRVLDLPWNSGEPFALRQAAASNGTGLL